MEIVVAAAAYLLSTKTDYFLCWTIFVRSVFGLFFVVANSRNRLPEKKKLFSCYPQFCNFAFVFTPLCPSSLAFWMRPLCFYFTYKRALDWYFKALACFCQLKLERLHSFCYYKKLAGKESFVIIDFYYISYRDLCSLFIRICARKFELKFCYQKIHALKLKATFLEKKLKKLALFFSSVVHWLATMGLHPRDRL